MTSRLKRKLNDLGVDTTSNRANENFCLIGTPLPPLEKSKDTGEFVPLWKQEVRDEKGRRRLHGAFTGGFSAGYFNSVGSKEGWTPATFTSSRSDRAKAKQVKPEDFMDEEDLAELRDSQKLVDTSESMDLDFWGKRGSATTENDESLVGALQNALLPEPVDSAGGKILKKMGWRVGHGIGPKLTYEQHKHEAMLAHSLMASGSQASEPEDHEEAKKHMYPRRDTKVVVIPRKDDKHGVGYDPGAGLNALNNRREDQGPREPNISAGFGLGALNDADEDDLDVYDRGMNQRSSRVMAYDDDEEEHERINMQRKRGQLKEENRSRQSRVQSFFKSGTPCLPVFVIAGEPVAERNLYPPPVVPEGWSPDPRRVWEADKETLKEISRPMEDIKNLPTQGKKATLTIDQRGDVLGEVRLPKEKRSVFDYLSPKDRERLKNMASGQVNAPTPIIVKEEPGPAEEEFESSVPRLDAQVAKMALHGFQPFTTDPAKQTRYTAYLKAQAMNEDSVPFQQLPGQNADSFKRELEDYARSALIFKPVSGAMAGRFARAQVVETGPKAVEGLHKPENEASYLSQSTVEEKEPVKEETPKENAARLGMYGALTREVKPWTPAKLLCKRFGVKEPQVELPSESGTKSSGPASQWQSGGVLAITDGVEAGLTGTTKINDGTDEPATSKSSAPKERDLANIGYGDEDETQGRDILTYQKPSMDIFKAIFASDEEDEDGNDDENEERSSVHQALERTSISQDNGVADVPSGTRRDEAASSRVPASGTLNGAAEVDAGTFKPKFVPRGNRETKDVERAEKDKPREKKKKKTKTIVSFDVDEGGDSTFPSSHGRDKERDREKKKRKKEKKEEEKEEKKTRKDVMDVEDDSMWVEKEAPAAIHSFEPAAVRPAGIDGDGDERKEMGPQRGRKRAVDFM